MAAACACIDPEFGVASKTVEGRASKLLLTHPTFGTFALQLEAGACIVLGRDATRADVSLAWDPAISRRHGQVYARDGRWWFKDLGSRNGSWVGDRRAEGPVELSAKTRVTLGTTTLELLECAQSSTSVVQETVDADGLPEVTLAHLRRLRASAQAAAQPLDVRWVEPGRVRIRVGDVRRLYEEELSKGALFVPGPCDTQSGTRVVIDLHTSEFTCLLSGELVYVGPGPDGVDGAGLAVSNVPKDLLSGREKGGEETRSLDSVAG